MSNWFSEKKNYSTSLASIHLINKIAPAIDRHETTAGVFLDLSKVFNTIDYQILFGKLEHYGIRGLALEGTKSYFVVANNLFNLILHVPLSRLLNVVSFKVLF